MKRYKRIMSLALSVVMALLATLCFSGCFGENLILRTYGDFIITQHNKIYDLSDEGLQKEYVIVPEKINGDYTKIYWTSGVIGAKKAFTKSEKLKKIRKKSCLEAVKSVWIFDAYFLVFASEKMSKSPVFMRFFELFEIRKMRQKSQG